MPRSCILKQKRFWLIFASLLGMRDPVFTFFVLPHLVRVRRAMGCQISTFLPRKFRILICKVPKMFSKMGRNLSRTFLFRSLKAHEWKHRPKRYLKISRRAVCEHKLMFETLLCSVFRKLSRKHNRARGPRTQNRSETEG